MSETDEPPPVELIDDYTRDMRDWDLQFERETGALPPFSCTRSAVTQRREPDFWETDEGRESMSSAAELARQYLARQELAPAPNDGSDCG
jgi:hypothetical protein